MATRHVIDMVREPLSRVGRLPASATPERLVTIAGVWAAFVMLVGAAWALGAPGCPFGVADRRADEVGSVFVGASTARCGLALTAAGGVGVVVAALARRDRLGRSRWLLGVAALVAATFLLVIPDIRVIQNFAYLFFGYIGLWDSALLAMVLSIGGGALWSWFVVAAWRARRAGPLRPPSWGTAVTYLAAALALPYPVVRIGWALGLPVGVDSSYVADQDLVLRVGEALLGGLAIGGAVLTLGLIRRWGEVFPGWVPLVRRRRVPVWFAVVPGLWSALVISQMGVRILVWLVSDDSAFDADNWGEGAPGLVFLPWGLALAAAVYAYAVRRAHDASRRPAECSEDRRSP
jgi:hypothetical protein